MKRIVIYKDNKSEWRGKIVARNGKILLVTGESYKRKAGVKKALMASYEILYSFVNN